MNSHLFYSIEHNQLYWVVLN